MVRERTPYAGIDPPVRQLVRVLNRFPGVCTYTSDGGHDGPQYDAQVPAGCWYVDSHIDRSDEGHASLEFFAWVAYTSPSRRRVRGLRKSSVPQSPRSDVVLSLGGT